MAADLSGRAALITGAASGIGRASALGFASAGASVALLDVDAEGLADTAAAVRAAGGHAEALVADVRDLQAVTGAVGRAVESFGRLDAALNNAGVPGPYLPLDEYSEQDFMQILQVDLAGVGRCMRAEIRHMRVQGHGAIVNTSSMLGAAAMPDNGAYVAAKHGVHGLTRAAAYPASRRMFSVSSVRASHASSVSSWCSCGPRNSRTLSMISSRLHRIRYMRITAASTRRPVSSV